ncbi:hypothetical protein NDU88_005231 [Pleurodeles waltl]|uniref:Uncharacterized protein n=1 Tax=Pleurodeles waltl TaxID=8319 RepID=A0AAV7L6X8_PLEWA|nr:hypothetical protein NDU88_005231 [Pleurodeles waltl]
MHSSTKTADSARRKDPLHDNTEGGLVVAQDPGPMVGHITRREKGLWLEAGNIEALEREEEKHGLSNQRADENSAGESGLGDQAQQ